MFDRPEVRRSFRVGSLLEIRDSRRAVRSVVGEVVGLGWVTGSLVEGRLV
jgi:hypothetical protein